LKIIVLDGDSNLKINKMQFQPIFATFLKKIMWSSKLGNSCSINFVYMITLQTNKYFV